VYLYTRILHSIETMVGKKKKFRTTVNAAFHGNLSACHFGHARRRFVSPLLVLPCFPQYVSGNVDREASDKSRSLFPRCNYLLFLIVLTIHSTLFNNVYSKNVTLNNVMIKQCTFPYKYSYWKFIMTYETCDLKGSTYLKLKISKTDTSFLIHGRDNKKWYSQIRISICFSSWNRQ
jgi:hypothetical protein